MGGQDKALCKEAMRTITPQNGILIRPLGKWTRTVHIQHTALLAQETVTFYAKEATEWGGYISWTETISNRFGPTCRQWAQEEHPP